MLAAHLLFGLGGRHQVSVSLTAPHFQHPRSRGEKGIMTTPVEESAPFAPWPW